MSVLSLPLYSSSCLSPSYSLEPLLDERTLEHNLHHFRPSARATFTKRAAPATIILRELEEAVGPHGVPLYSHNSVITGEIHLSSAKDIYAVVVKLEGQVELMITEGGSKSKQLFSNKYTLWTSNRFPGTSCPSILPFSCRIPSAYKDGPRTRSVPPSYRVAFYGPPGLFAACVYTLVVAVTKKSHRYLSFLTGCQKIRIRLNHIPRTRPNRPILQNNSMLSTIKPSPEEWRQVTTTMPTRPSSGVTPIVCHLFIPAAQIYGVSDTIPFHVQLTAPSSSLLAFLPSYSDATSSASPDTSPIRVFLLRQVLVEVRGQKGWRNCELGNGNLWALPPVAANAIGENDESLDWEGEVRCRADTTIGGFNIGNLVVKDFIVLAMKPPHPETSTLLELQYPHPIRLVTDSWSEISRPESE